MLNGLERRVLLSSSISSGKLTITGTDNADQILVSLSGNSVYVYDNGVEKTYTGVTSISADTKGGNDLLRIAQDVTVNASVIGGSGNDSLRSGGGNDTMRGGDGNDSLAGYGGNDVLHGDNNNDTLVGGSGNDALHGGGGDDRLQGGGGGDYLDGGSGNDTNDYTERTQKVTFTLYGSTVYTDPVTGLGGQGTEQDVTWSVETVQGGSGNDVLTYQGYDNTTPTGNPVRGVLLSGNGGIDNLSALNQPVFDQANSVTLRGGEGGDTFHASSGPRLHVIGDSGDDLMNLGDEENNRSRITADLGSGIDTVLYQTDPASGELTLPAGAERLQAHIQLGGSMTINGNGLNNEIVLFVDTATTVTVNAGGGNDKITINPADDPFGEAAEGQLYLNGGTGNDTIQGSAMREVIHGDDGNDSLLGGAGDDTLFGDAGTDFLDGQGGTDVETP